MAANLQPRLDVEPEGPSDRKTARLQSCIDLVSFVGLGASKAGMPSSFISNWCLSLL